MLAEVPQLIEPENPDTPLGLASAIGKFSEASAGQGDINIAWVQAGGNRFAAVVSGAYESLLDNTPDQATFSHGQLNKSSTSHPLHDEAMELAGVQTRHELLRLFKLVKDYWGTNEHLIEAWIHAGEQEAFRDLLQTSVANGRSLERLANEIKQGDIQHLTVVTHGFQLNNTDGDSLMGLAQAIHHRSGGWLVDYDVPSEGQRGYFQLHHVEDRLQEQLSGGQLQSKGSAVLLFDWAAESNEMSAGWTEAAGDALFTMLARLGVIESTQASAATPKPNQVKLHFIAHSFGSAVTTEAIERLGFYGVQVDQLTLLDPHDFDEENIPVDGEQDQASIGAIPGYGATVWSNIAFADVYYQTTPIPLVPEGRPIPGATNYNVTTDPLVSAGFNPHSNVWEGLYRQTVISPGSRSFGYRFAATYGDDPNLSTAVQPSARPAAAFHQPPAGYTVEQDHQHTVPRCLKSSRSRCFSGSHQLATVRGEWRLRTSVQRIRIPIVANHWPPSPCSSTG
jgi:hypothetical protein